MTNEPTIPPVANSRCVYYLQGLASGPSGRGLVTALGRGTWQSAGDRTSSGDSPHHALMTWREQTTQLTRNDGADPRWVPAKEDRGVLIAKKRKDFVR